MTKILGLTVAFLFAGMFMYGQCSKTTKTANAEKTSCTQAEMKKCAAKMGMTLEECKAACSSAMQGSGSSSAMTSNAGVVTKTSMEEGSQKLSCGMTYEQCAAKMGMTVEECKKVCKANQSSAATKTSSGASATASK